MFDDASILALAIAHQQYPTRALFGDRFLAIKIGDVLMRYIPDFGLGDFGLGDRLMLRPIRKPTSA
ncbi:MAG: hypothetical protein HC895_14145 [Leptolyngbyaceae cyanobacterium SM1_3_5]|nr:hypothetical protein [Leptolyngbyaceae cyanobacterium SM1_3_5]